MAEITKPIALDESFNTTEGSPRNVADVLAQGIGDLVTVVSRISHQTTYDELSDLEDVNISAPTNGDVLTYDGSKWTNGQGGGGSTEQMIAPVETSTTASQAYAIGEQFILNGVLYTATAAITAGGTITIGGNCTTSDTVTEQIQNIKQGESVSVTADGVKTYATLFNELYALIDSTKLTVKSMFTIGEYIYTRSYYTTGGGYQFTSANLYNQTLFIERVNIRTNSSYDRCIGTTYSNNSATVPANGTKLIIHY